MIVNYVFNEKKMKFVVYIVGMLEKYIKCFDFIARHNISPTLPLKCIPAQKIRKFCCALICGLCTASYINWFPALSLKI